MNIILRPTIFTVFSMAMLSSCEDRGEEGGAHGDRDKGMETSLQQNIDVPPYVTDPMEIEEALKRNPENNFFGWSHLKSIGDSSAWGHFYFGYDEKGLQARVNLTNAESSQKYTVKIAPASCFSQLRLQASEVRQIGAVETDAQGRLFSDKILFNRPTDKVSIEQRCSTGNLSARVFQQDELIACGEIGCVKENIRRSH